MCIWDKILKSHIVKAAREFSSSWWGGDIRFYDDLANGFQNDMPIQNPFCRYLHSYESGKEKCLDNCRKHLKNAHNIKTPYIYKCHAGLFVVITSVYIGGEEKRGGKMRGTEEEKGEEGGREGDVWNNSLFRNTDA